MNNNIKEKFVKWMVGAKAYLKGLGLVGSILMIGWWIIKIIACTFFGFCII